MTGIPLRKALGSSFSLFFGVGFLGEKGARSRWLRVLESNLQGFLVLSFSFPGWLERSFPPSARVSLGHDGQGHLQVIQGSATTRAHKWDEGCLPGDPKCPVGRWIIFDVDWDPLRMDPFTCIRHENQKESSVTYFVGETPGIQWNRLGSTQLTRGFAGLGVLTKPTTRRRWDPPQG